MRTLPPPAPCRRFVALNWLVVLLSAAMLSSALVQNRLERSGITLYWGLVLAAVVADKHAFTFTAWPPHRSER